MTALLTALLQGPPAPVPFAGFADWWARTAPLRARWPGTVERAVALGFAADRLGMAFAGGYASAVLALDPSLPEEPGALCATEDGGAHPRAIAARLEGGRLTGTKRFVSGAPWARTLLVVASEGTGAGGRNRLRVVRVPAGAPGVRLEPGPELPFVPEVPHASVVFDGVEVQPADVLPGDGYDAYLKPFRTIEDLHVHGAALGYLLGVARRAGWPPALREGLVAALATAVALRDADPRAPSTHVALAGLLGLAERLLADAEPCWEAVEPAERTRFARDRALLQVAGKAREARRVRAWELLGGPPPS